MASDPLESNLYKAFHDQANWRYQAVTPGGGGNSNRMLDEAMAASGLRLIPQKISTITGRAKVYVRPGATLATAEAAHAAFDRWRGSPKIYVTGGSTARQADDTIKL